MLAELAFDEADSTVREAARRRYCDCLAGVGERPAPLDQRLAAVTGCTHPDVLAQIASHGREAEVRIAALTRIEDESLCAEIAIRDPVAQVRRAALDKVTARATLDRVAKETRQRDKGISRLARERSAVLDAEARVAAKLRAECESICHEMEILLPIQDPTRLKDGLAKLEMRWRRLASSPPQDLATRYGQAHGSALQSLENLRIAAASEQASEDGATQELRSQKINLCENVENLLHELERCEALEPETERRVIAALDVTQRGWGEIQPLPGPEEKQFQAHFTQAGDAVRARLATLLRERGLRNAVADLFAKAQALLIRSGHIDEPTVQDLARQRAALEPLSPDAGDLGRRFQDLLDQLSARLRQEREDRAQALASLEDRVKRLEQAVEAGELAAAETLVAELEAAPQGGRMLPSHRVKALHERLRKARERARDLAAWRGWAGTLERERLCDEVEGLIGRSADAPEIAARIKELRGTWNHLGPLQSARDHTLSRRFNRACEQAYVPCRAYFRAQAEERAANLAARQELCTGLEQLLTTTDWEAQVDWAATERLARDARTRWTAIGPVDRKEVRTVQERFEAAMAMLAKHLRAERERNFDAKLEIVRMAEGLAEQGNVREATRQIPALRQRWQQVGPTSAPKERALRRRFEAACGAVAERRRQQVETLRRERAVNEERKEALCQRLEAMAALDGPELESAARSVARLREEWQAVGSVPREVAEGLERRFREGLTQVQERCRARHWQVREERLQNLARKAELCAGLEELWVDAPRDLSAERVEAAHQEWAALPALDPDLERAIGDRFARACALALDAQAGGAVELEQERRTDLAAKETLCVRMEILAGVESPPGAVEARLRYQLERLAQEMGRGGTQSASLDALEEVWQLERAWYLAGPLPLGTEAGLEQRFQYARRVFYEGAGITAIAPALA